MARDYSALLSPAHTAVVTMELQNGVVGDTASIRALADEVALTNLVANAARLVIAARRAGAAVVHCLAEFSADPSAMRTNAPLLRALAQGEPNLIVGTKAAQLVAELGPEPDDVISARRTGLTPFPATDLDQTLRDRNIKTIVVAGVSINIGITGLAMVAVDLGYEVVLATDAIAGVPRDYGKSMIEHTLRALCTCLTTEEIVAYFDNQSQL